MSILQRTIKCRMIMFFFDTGFTEPYKLHLVVLMGHFKQRITKGILRFTCLVLKLFYIHETDRIQHILCLCHTL
jgi:hypothetical protein